MSLPVAKPRTRTVEEAARSGTLLPSWAEAEREMDANIGGEGGWAEGRGEAERGGREVEQGRLSAVVEEEGAMW